MGNMELVHGCALQRHGRSTLQSFQYVPPVRHIAPQR
jgi:hypothetical protein